MNKDDPDVRVTSANPSSHYLINVGEWIRVKMHMKLNTVGNANGNMTYYINGQEMWNEGGGTDSKILRDTSACTWLNGAFAHFHGGSTTDWRSPIDTTQKVYLDNMVIAASDPDA